MRWSLVAAVGLLLSQTNPGEGRHEWVGRAMLSEWLGDSCRAADESGGGISWNGDTLRLEPVRLGILPLLSLPQLLAESCNGVPCPGPMPCDRRTIPVFDRRTSPSLEVALRHNVPESLRAILGVRPKGVEWSEIILEAYEMSLSETVPGDGTWHALPLTPSDYEGSPEIMCVVIWLVPGTLSEAELAAYDGSGLSSLPEDTFIEIRSIRLLEP